MMQHVHVGRRHVKLGCLLGNYRLCFLFKVSVESHARYHQTPVGKTGGNPSSTPTMTLSPSLTGYHPSQCRAAMGILTLDATSGAQNLH